MVNSLFTRGRLGYHVVWIRSPPPSYHELRNFSNFIKLSYTTSSSTPQVHLPRIGTTISPTRSFPASAPPPCTAHIWSGRPRFPIWSPVASWCTPRLGGYPRPPLLILLRGIPTLRMPRVSTSSLWSLTPPGGGTPPGPWAYPPSPPRYRYRTIAPTLPCDLSVQCHLVPLYNNSLLHYYNWYMMLMTCYRSIFTLFSCYLVRSIINSLLCSN